MSQQDVLIIGGGIMGCSVAWKLAEKGQKVTVLERSVPGAEASSAAAGMLAPQKESATPGPLLDLGLASRAMYPSFIRELEEISGIQVDFNRSGTLEVAFDDATLQKLQEKVRWQSALGLQARSLTRERALQQEPKLSPSIQGAALFPDDCQVDSRKLVRALSSAAYKSGVSFRTGYVRSVVSDHNQVIGVDVEGDVLRANHVVVAAGSWSGLIPGTPLSPKLIRPVRGQMLQFETRLPLLNTMVSCTRGYLVPRKDGRLIAGSTAEFVGYEKKVTAEGLSKLLQMAIEVCPELAQAPVCDMWAGLRPFSEDALPILSPTPCQGLIVATGHHRNGILLAPVSAKLVAELVLSAQTSYDLAPFRLSRFHTS